MRPLRDIRRLGLASLGLLGLLGAGASLRDVQGPPYSPEQSLALTRVAPGFRVELFAAEPLLADPVAMEIDEEGRIYVAVDHGYPDDPSGRGAVRLLEDTDGDGRPDRSTLFARNLRMPRGVLRWKKGILVADAPDLLYLEDSDGDGVADVRRTLLTGFGTGNPQLGLNTPLYGLDNWIYVAHSEGDTELQVVRADGTRVKGPDVRRRNFRFDPETGAVEALAARTQFGHTFDPWGSHLLNTNNNHLYHEVIGAEYLERNPDLLVGSAVETLPEHGGAADVFAISPDPGFQLFTDAGVITSACGLTAYLGGAFPSGYEAVTFVAEPAHNLVHADLLEDHGATFRARRLFPDREFLASADGWFRPVNFYVGPDGALYVVDYHRAVVEQPAFLSEEVIRSGVLHAGNDRGRIYRVIADRAPEPGARARPRLGSAPTEELVNLLSHPNLWWRRTAQRLLVDRRDPAAVGRLVATARRSARPEGRVHALWTLAGMDALTPELLAAVLRDPAAGVRRNAIRAAEPRLDTSPELARELLRMEADPDPKVRFQLLLTLGYLSSGEAREVRRRLLRRDAQDPWVQVAALSAADIELEALLSAAEADFGGAPTRGGASYFRRLGSLAGARPAESAAILQRALDPAASARSAWWRGALLEGVAARLRPNGMDARALASVRDGLTRAWIAGGSPEILHAAVTLLDRIGLPTGGGRPESVATARRRAADPALDATVRADAVRFLALAGPDDHRELLERLLDPREPVPVQIAAVAALDAAEGRRTAVFLLERWPALTPEVREPVAEALVRSDERAALLVAAVGEGRVEPSSVGWYRAKRLMRSSDPAVRERARKLFARGAAGEADAVERFRPALGLEGDPARGATVFARSCAMCHQVGGRDGAAFGPDLRTVRTRSPERLLVDILEPNREVVAGFEQWEVVLKEGGSLVGIISEETPNSITLRAVGGIERALPRARIERLQAVEPSAMPEGLGHQLDPQAMADLLTFLRR